MRFLFPSLGFLALLSACGGGGGGGDAFSPDSVAPPPPASGMSFANNTPIYRIGVPITPAIPTLEAGVPVAFSVAPPLPDGLVLDPTNGAVSGTPIAWASGSEHTVRASLMEGEDAWAVLRIDVRPMPDASLEPMVAFSDEDIRHFLDRTHFGFDQAIYDRILAVGMSRYVDEMLALPFHENVEHDANDRYLEDANDPQGRFPSSSDLARWWTYLLIWNPNPFQEVLALHWHDHFATSTEVLDSGSRWWFPVHVNLLRRAGNGNLRTFLVSLARDWSMLEWLDGVRNNGAPGKEPNENFAREWFELFTLGVDHGYTESDIVEAARAFSGYRRTWDGERSHVEFQSSRHDGDTKWVLGQTIATLPGADDYEAMVDATLALRDPTGRYGRCAQWIIRSLLRRFAYENPPDDIVDPLALALESGGYELRPILRKLFLSEAFYGPAAREPMVKNPIEFAVGFMRTTGLRGDAAKVDTSLQALGMRPTQPPGVEGWPESRGWLSAQGMIDRANFVRYAITAREFQGQLGIQIQNLLPDPPQQDPESIVDALTKRLRIRLSADDRSAYVTYLNSTVNAAGEVLSDPFDAASPSHLDERLRGLLYILAQHPTYMTR